MRTEIHTVLLRARIACEARDSTIQDDLLDELSGGTGEVVSGGEGGAPEP